MIHGSLLHSVSYSGSWGQYALPLEDFIDKAAELGYNGVMLMAKRPHLSVLDCTSDHRSRLRARLQEHGLRMGCVAGYTNFTADMEHGDIPHREIQIRHVTELAEIARDLGGELVRVFTGYESPVATPHAQWKMTVDALRECARRAADFGVTIGVQNHHDIACGVDSLYDLIREVDEPNCRAMFDAWAPALHGADLAAAARKMAKLTVQTTIANYQLCPRYKYVPTLVNYEEVTPSIQAVPIDEGFIDYREFLTNLESGGYSGAVAYEMCSPLLGGGGEENLDRYARKFLEFVRAFGSTAACQGA
jgi:sugar phosphate isomerase/epimerase